MKQLILYLFLGISSGLHAVNNLRLPDVRSMGIGGGGVTESLFFNPSLVSRTESVSFDAGYFNYYGLKELGTVNLAFCYPNGVLPAGVHIASFGYDRYRQSMVRLFFGKRVAERWSVGVSVQYIFLQTELAEGNPQSLSTDVSVLFSPVEKLLVTLLIMDLPSVSVGKKEIDTEDIISYSVQIGFQWEAINNLFIVGNAGTERQRAFTGNIGIEYRLFDSFYLRSGMKITPLLPAFGIGYRLSGFTVDVAAVYHPVLGMSGGVGLKYSF